MKLLEGLLIRIGADASLLDKVLNHSVKGLEDFGKKAANAGGGAKLAVDGLIGSVTGLQGLIAGLTSAAVVVIGKDLVDTFGAAERAVQTLNAALQTTGRDSSSLNRLTANADRLQIALNADGNALTEVTGAIALLNRSLDTKELENAQDAVVALSDALHIDLRSAGFLVEKTLGGTMNMLGRYGIQIDTTKDAHGRLNEIMQKTAGMLAVAESKTTTYEGAVRAVDLAVGELKETMGEIILEGLNLSKVLGKQGLAGDLNDLNAELDENKEKIIDAIRWVKGLGSVVVNVVYAFKNSVAALMGGMATIIVSVVNTVVQAVGKMTEVATNKINGLIRQTQKIPLIGKNLHTLENPFANDPAFGFLDNLESKIKRGTRSFAYAATKNIVDIGHAFDKSNPMLKDLNFGAPVTPGSEHGAGSKQGGSKAAGDKSSSFNKDIFPDIPKFDGFKKAMDELAQKYEIQAGLQKDLMTGEERAKMLLTERLSLIDQLRLSEDLRNRALKAYYESLEQGEEIELRGAADLKRRNELLKSIKQPMEELVEKQNDLNVLLADPANVESVALLKQEILNTNQALDELKNGGISMADTLKNATLDFGKSFRDTLVDMVTGAEISFSDIVASFSKSIAQMIIQWAIIEPLFGPKGAVTMLAQSVGAGIAGAIGGSVGGGGASAVSAPLPGGGIGYYAEGGIAPMGKMAMVGENGPELITPATNTRVIPNKNIQVGGGGENLTVHQSFTVHATDPRAFRDMLASESGLLNQMAVTAIRKEQVKRRGNARLT